jgi:hypothetical protein
MVTLLVLAVLVVLDLLEDESEPLLPQAASPSVTSKVALSNANFFIIIPS